MKFLIKQMSTIAIILLLFTGCTDNTQTEENTPVSDQKENKISQETTSKEKIDIGGGYFKDDKFVYVDDEHGLVKVNKADHQSFQSIGENFGKDKNHVFYWKNILNDADLNSFEVLNNSHFSKDKKNAFYFDHKIPNVDISTFSALNNTYAKDKNNIYEYYSHDNHIVENADVETFTVFNHESSYAKDKNYIFYDGFPITGADLESFEFINHNFGKDKNYVYCMHFKTDLDKNTFEIIGKGIYGKDKDGVYCLISDIPEKKLEILIKEADPNSFEEVFIHQEAFYAKDKNHVYLDSKIIKNADPETFIVFDDFRYSKDKDHTYKRGVLLENIDPEEFSPKGDRQAGRPSNSKLIGNREGDI